MRSTTSCGGPSRLWKRFVNVDQNPKQIRMLNNIGAIVREGAGTKRRSTEG